MKSLTIVLYVLALLLGLVMWLSPVFSGYSFSGTNVRVGLAVAVTYMCLHMLTVWLFLAGLHNFKTTLRRPYIILCIGLIMTAVAQLQLPVAVIIGALWWITSGALLLLYIVPNVVIHIGIRSFAQLAGVKSRWTSYRFAMPLVLVPAIVSFALPVKLSAAAPTLQAAHFFVALPLWQACISIVGAYLVWRIKRTMGAAYASAMHWLFVGMAGYAVVSLHFVILSYIGYESSWYGRNATLDVFVVLGTIFVIAGYKFYQIGGHQTARRKNASALDVVIYTAGLATNANEVDSILDKMRMLTARMAPGQALAPEDEKILCEIYLELEEYLIKREPLRKITRKELRQSLTEQFRPNSQHDSHFWGTISSH
jgi:hypothetical protein